MAQRFLSAGSVHASRDGAIAVEQHVIGIGAGPEARSHVALRIKRDPCRPWAFLQVGPDCLLGLADIHRKHRQTLAGIGPLDGVHCGLIAATVLAPRCPELQQYRLPGERAVGQSIAIECLNRELRCAARSVRFDNRACEDSTQQSARDRVTAYTVITAAKNLPEISHVEIVSRCLASILVAFFAGAENIHHPRRGIVGFVPEQEHANARVP